MQRPLTVDFSTCNNVVVARPSADLTGPACEELSTQLSDRLAVRGTRLVIDLARVKLVSSAGLSALVGLAAQANLQESRLVLTNLSPYVANVLELTRLIKFFDVALSMDEALTLALSPRDTASSCLNCN
jgi:anti-anti-sigma factor